MATLLLIDDSESHRRTILESVAPARIFDHVIEAGDGVEGLKHLLSDPVDVVLCDLEMPGFEGEKILHLKQASPSSRDIPIIFVTASSDPDRRARLLVLGANDVITKPFHGPDLMARLNLQLRTKRLHDELKLKTETMSRLSTTDAVTGLRTRRYVSEALAIECLRARRYGSPLCILMADLDHFKLVNDEYGHLAGDSVLHGVARILLEQLRATDIAGRYGGEEMLVILTNNDVEGGEALAERWRMCVEEAAFDTADGRTIQTQISIGVAAWGSHMQAPDQLVARADEMLYRAKANGRNLVVSDRQS